MYLFVFFKLQDYEIEFSHKSHLKGFTPVCVHLCFFKLPDCENDFSQKSHLNVLLLYELIYVYSNCKIVKLISYTNNIYMVSFLYVFIYVFFKSPDNENDFSHKFHLNSFTPV